MTAADAFVEVLHARLCLGQHDAHTLLELDPLRRCDPLFEAAADLSDVLCALGQGHGGANLVREQALKVATLAAQLWLVSTGGEPLETEGGDEREW